MSTTRKQNANEQDNSGLKNNKTDRVEFNKNNEISK